MPKSNTTWMAEEYKNAAEAAGHNVTLVNVAHKHIAGFWHANTATAREIVRKNKKKSRIYLHMWDFFCTFAP